MTHIKTTHVGSMPRDETLTPLLLARDVRKTRLICGNVVIDVVSETEAKGVSAMALYMPDAAPKLGSFYDDFVMIDGRWLFAARRGSLSF